jgi:spoIIIJ-associated protein
MTHVETSGRTVEDAVLRALEELGVTREDVDVEVLDPGARGMLGLGAREPRVRVTLRDNPASVAHTFMARLLRLMGFAGTVRVREQDGMVAVQVTGEHLGALIGRRGATLDALQFLLGLMVARQTHVRTRVMVDVEGYRERRRVIVEDLAHRAAERAEREGREIALEPMDAADRRIVHTTLSESPAVMTFSRGEGPARHVVVAPKTQVVAPDVSESDDGV